MFDLFSQSLCELSSHSCSLGFICVSDKEGCAFVASRCERTLVLLVGPMVGRDDLFPQFLSLLLPSFMNQFGLVTRHLRC
jgi:hypothetical protein